MLFTVIEDQAVLRRTNGVYTQVKLALRGDELFACVGSGFIRLYANQATSSPSIRWDYIENQDAYKPDKFNRLTTLPQPSNQEPQP